MKTMKTIKKIKKIKKIKSIYNEETKIYTHKNELFKVHQSRHCALNRIANKCQIYTYTSGGCDGCGQNRKLINKKTRSIKGIKKGIKIL